MKAQVQCYQRITHVHLLSHSVQETLKMGVALHTILNICVHAVCTAKRGLYHGMQVKDKAYKMIILFQVRSFRQSHGCSKIWNNPFNLPASDLPLWPYYRSSVPMAWCISRLCGAGPRVTESSWHHRNKVPGFNKKKKTESTKHSPLVPCERQLRHIQAKQH